MVRWFRTVLPWVAALSLVANLYLVGELWKREAYANHYLWGNTTNRLILGVTWGATDRDPEMLVALETLDSIRALPRYNQRVDASDLKALARFLRYASQTRSQADQEWKETGGYSAETSRRLGRINQGFDLILNRLHRVNELEHDSYTFNHGAWRTMWQEIAAGLPAAD